MTDAEIKKALECHADTDVKTCEICPYEDKKQCAYLLSADAFDLINRQQAEIERLRDEVATYKRIGDKKTEAVIQHDDFIRDLHKEIERLTERNFELAEKGEAVCIAYKTARAEVTEQLSKKIESRLANNTDISNSQYQSIIFDISEACKEMVGEG